MGLFHRGYEADRFFLLWPMHHLVSRVWATGQQSVLFYEALFHTYPCNQSWRSPLVVLQPHPRVHRFCFKGLRIGVGISGSRAGQGSQTHLGGAEVGHVMLRTMDDRQLLPSQYTNKFCPVTGTVLC